MLSYDNQRTLEIVQRLVASGNTIRSISITWHIILLGSFLATAGSTLLPGSLGGWLGALLGIALGYALGSYLGALLAALLEWTAQVLIAQGEILNLLKKLEGQ